MATPTLAHFKLPEIQNEPNHHYEPGSASRTGLQAALKEMKAGMPYEVGCVINGKETKTGPTHNQVIPHDHATVLCRFHSATQAQVQEAIAGTLAAKARWESLPFNDRAAIFLKAADLLSSPRWRYRIMAATMLGQGKNAWQAEIDAAAEMCDFFRFGAKYAEDMYAQQPAKNWPGIWNRTEYRPLEGFVFAISPFNFTAIGGNLVGAPALMGNVVLWKPSPMAVYANYLTYKLLEEAGVPAGVIQFLPVAADQVPQICKSIFANRDFASLHFTGSTAVFRQLWLDIAHNVANETLRSYPRIVGETGGKNFHVIHPSAKASLKTAVTLSIRAAFEYGGQKCSALSRLYVAKSLWPEFSRQLKRDVERIKVGDVEDPESFFGAVISKASFEKVTSYIEKAKQAGGEILVGGTSDSSKGYFIQPTVIVTKDPKSITMTTELFGPVITAYAYDDGAFGETCALVDQSSAYALTGALFCDDRAALVDGANRLRNAAGNFYINAPCTGAVVGQQPFGGARGSGTNDKAGSPSLLMRFVSARSIKEQFLPVEEFTYPSNVK